MTDAKPNAVGFYIRLYPEKWITLFEGSSDRDKATLIDLLLRMARDGEALNDDPMRLARVIGRKEKALSATLEVLEKEGAITRDNGKISNHLMEVEFEYRRQKSVIGQKAANKRHAKNRMETIADGMRSHSGGNAISKIELELEIELEATASSSSKRDDDHDDDDADAKARSLRAGSQDYAILPDWRENDWRIKWEGIDDQVRHRELLELIRIAGDEANSRFEHWYARSRAFNPATHTIADMNLEDDMNGAVVLLSLATIVCRAPPPIHSWLYLARALGAEMESESEHGSLYHEHFMSQGLRKTAGT